MEFAVVTFSKDGSTSEIPAKWIIADDDSTSNNRCWWPSKRTKNISTLIQKKVDPKDGWNVEELSHIKFCRTYERARNLAENSDYTSGDNPESGKGKRTKFRNIRYQDRSSDDENNNGQFSSTDLPPTLPIDTAPQEETNEININDLPIIYEEQQITSQRVVNEESHIRDNVQSAQSIDHHTDQQGFLNLQQIKDQLSSIQRVVVAMDLKIDDLAQRIDKIGPSPKLIGTTENIKKILPLSNRESVDVFEKQLENATVMNEFLIYIDKIGGNTPEENVRQILSKVFTNEFAKNHTWAGRKDKFCISELKMIKTIKDKILSERAGFRENNFDHEGKEWFRLGNQRFTREERKKN